MLDIVVTAVNAAQLFNTRFFFLRCLFRLPQKLAKVKSMPPHWHEREQQWKKDRQQKAATEINENGLPTLKDFFSQKELVPFQKFLTSLPQAKALFNDKFLALTGSIVGSKKNCVFISWPIVFVNRPNLVVDLLD
jgi:hypothetical protein